ncbi:MAG: hypothetical protein AB7I48_10110 [Planctomycetaceae bacterium]
MEGFSFEEGDDQGVAVEATLGGPTGNGRVPQAQDDAHSTYIVLVDFVS